MVGAVSRSRYAQIVAELRGVTGQQTQGQFTIGDRALEIEPIRPCSSRATGATRPAAQSLARLAEDLGLPVTTIQQARWTASRWPADRRRKTESFTVHRVLAGIDDERERFAAIDELPDGKTRWTVDDATQRLGTQGKTPAAQQGTTTVITPRPGA
ncbi:DUF6192 family protein [Streptomyces sp. NPDC052287]|uniref:DUF6192 family protein n=1 Tax=unclassified Streptomyces TaxID=2593676 RepID=UPI00143EB1FB|nr:DUF6192 family protein [Streptomyces sp. RPA4-2]QIY66464.1 hypothetical protein HEP85_39400 [Streptomyces sp. RPA4-2]